MIRPSASGTGSITLANSDLSAFSISVFIMVPAYHNWGPTVNPIGTLIGVDTARSALTVNAIVTFNSLRVTRQLLSIWPKSLQSSIHSKEKAILT